MRRGEGLSQLIRYEQQTKSKIQQTDNTILSGRRDREELQHLSELIKEQDILIKYLQVESSKMMPQVRTLYNKNLNRFKKKIKQHKEYVNSLFGAGAISNYHDPYSVGRQISLQQQNNELIGQKLTMYDNQQVQQRVALGVEQQGQMLQREIDINHQIRDEASEAEDTIKLIQRAILKRKIMFYSMFILLGLAVLWVGLHKLNK